MSARPAEYTQWATDGGAVITEPPLARKEEGWVPLFAPSAAYQNWWMNRVGKWVEYFDTSNLSAPKGWTTVPAETISGGGTTIAFGVGVVLTGGKLYDVPASASFSGLAASTDYYWSFVVLSGTVEQFTSWDTANAGTNVPLFWAKTSAGSLVTASASSVVAKRVLDFPDSLTLTVSSDPVHRAHFTTLKQALAAAQAIQQGSTLAAPAIRIEVIGSVTEPSPIDEVEVYGCANITIAGRAAGSSTAQSARILFSSATKGLFYVPSGASILSWSFEDLAFGYTGNATSAEVAVLSAQTGSTVSGLNFFRCSSTATNPLNKFPHFIYTEVAISNLVIHDCRISNSETMIHQTAGGIAGLDVRSVVFNRFAALTDVGTVFGFIVSKAGSSSRWRINGCTVGESLTIKGPAVEAFALDGAWITGNRFELSGNSSAILLGDTAAAAPTGVNRIWITDNYIERIFASISSASVVRIRTADDALGAAQVFIHSNAIMGDDVSAPTAKGIELDAGSGSLSQPIVHSNSISRVLEGVYLTAGITKGVIAGNAMTVRQRGVFAPSTCSKLVISGNVLAQSTPGTSLNIDSPNTIAIGNHNDGSFSFGANSHGLILAASNFDTGGSFVAGIDDVLVVGNRLGSSVTVNAVTDFLAIGNMFFGPGLTLGCSGGILASNHIEDPLFDPASGQNVINGNQFGGAVTLTGNNNSFVCNRVPGAVLLDNGDNGIFNSNYLESTLNVTLDANGWIVGGNNVVGTATVAGLNTVVAGNGITGSGTFSSDELVASGNQFSDVVSVAGARSVFTGNSLDSTLTLTSTADDSTVSGNRVDAAYTVNTLAAKVITSSNRMRSTMTDAGSGDRISAITSTVAADNLNLKGA